MYQTIYIWIYDILNNTNLQKLPVARFDLFTITCVSIQLKEMFFILYLPLYITSPLHTSSGGSPPHIAVDPILHIIAHMLPIYHPCHPDITHVTHVSPICDPYITHITHKSSISPISPYITHISPLSLIYYPYHPTCGSFY